MINVGLVRYACTRCDHAQVIRQLPYRRLFTDGTSGRVVTVIAWCHDQAKLAESEDVPALRALEALLARAERDAAGGTPVPEPKGQPSLEQLRRELTWRKGRSAPPRCLECGSIRIVQHRAARPGDVPQLEHPGCGGQLVVRGLDVERYEGPEIPVDVDGRRGHQ